MLKNTIQKINIKSLIILNPIIFLVTLNVFEVAQVIIVEGSTSFGYNTFFNNLWWFNSFFGILILLILPQGFFLINYILKYSKYLYAKLSIKKMKLKTQNAISILFIIILLNIIIMVKISHVLNFDFLNYLTFSFLFIKNFELFNYLYLLNIKVFSQDFIPFLYLNKIMYTNINYNSLLENIFEYKNINIIYGCFDYISTISYFIKYDLINVTNENTCIVKLSRDVCNWNNEKIEKLSIVQEGGFLYNTLNLTFFFSKIDLNIFKDGITFWLLWLVSLVFFVISFGTNKKLYKKNIIFENFHVYNHLLILILILMVICFSIKNILIFFISFETILIPLFLHIMFQGSRLNKIQAIKYLVMYTLIGSAFLWYTISYFIEISGSADFDQLRWVLIEYSTVGTRRLLFILLFLGFAFKVPLVPFHHWLIIAHVEAPTNGSIILAALLLKVGGYGLYRFAYTIFPMESLYFSNEILVISLFGYTFATILAIRQIDLKRYIAYTSIAHMNFSLLGLFSTFNVGILGYVHLMISHGIIASAMFFLVGYIYSILNFRDTVRLSGLAYNFPKFSFFFFIFSMANMGLPLFSGFPGEFFIIISIISNNTYFGLFIFFGFIFSGVYNFFQLNKVLFSTSMNLLNLKKKDDLSSTSIIVLSVLLYWSLALGLFPDIVTQNVEICI